MDKYLLRRFQTEVAFQCKAILIATNHYNQATQVKDGDALWVALQSILVSAANLSKLLWGSRGKLAERREPLRQSLGVADTSVLQDPDLRNDFEHFDERLDDWYEKGHSGFIGRNIGNPDAIQVEGFDMNTRFQHYDPRTGLVTFWKHTASIPDIVREAAQLLPVAEEVSQRLLSED